MSDSAAVRDDARTALLVSPDPRERCATAAVLDAAGFQVIAVATWSEAVTAEASVEIAIILLDDRIARDPSVRTAAEEVARQSLRQGALRDGIPLLLLVDLVDTVDYPGFRALRSADWMAKPVGAAEIVRRADELISTTRHRLAGRKRATALRASVREISAAIRSTNEPGGMAAVLVSGLGQTFDSTHVWFSAFQEGGSAHITTGARQEEGDLGIRDELLTALATRLWSEESILTVMDHPASFPADAEGWLNGWAASHGLTAFAAVPVGDQDTVLGLIVLGDSRGPRAWTSLDTSLITHLAQNLAYGLLQARLIAAQELLLTRMHELDRSKSDLMSTVNHELRTPLTAIAGYLELVEDGDGGAVPEEAAAMLRVVRHNVGRLQGLVNDMLTMSRLEANVTPAITSSVRLDRLLARVVESIHPLAVTGRVRLAVDTTAYCPVVVGEESQLERAFTNLIQNSVKFTPAAGTVRVSLESTVSDEGKAAVVVRIADTGIGIPADDLDRLFTRFFRASNATAAAIPGTGLGLAIVQSLIAAHGGVVRVESTVGVGTTFSVRLPLAESGASTEDYEPVSA